MKKILFPLMAAGLLLSCQPPTQKQAMPEFLQNAEYQVTDSAKAMYNHYAKWFADSEMKRFPEAWQLDHGKRLFFGDAQGVGCCAMLEMWKATGDAKYYDYVAEWADTIVFEDGNIHLTTCRPITSTISTPAKYSSMCISRQATRKTARLWICWSSR